MTETKIFQNCRYEKCDSVVVQAGHCAAHATQLRKGQELFPTGSAQVRSENTECSFDTCVRVSETFGLCYGHYQQQLRGRELTHLDPLEKPECSEEGCDRISTTRGMCKRHYNVWKLANAPECSFEGCTKGTESKGLCRGHGAQRRAGKELTPLRGWGKFTAGTKCPVTYCDKHAIGERGCTKHTAMSNTYNLTSAQISELPQGCGVCGSTTRLNIDHDHACCDRPGSCGECVRGVLCGNCNSTLGHAKDDIDRLRGLIAYLERHNRPDLTAFPQVW